MAKLVEIIGVTHQPFLPKLMQDPNSEPTLKDVAGSYEMMHQKMRKARPDVLLVIGNDHLSQWFMDNIPAFCIGKSPVAQGPFSHEIRDHGLTSYQSRVDVEFARGLLRECWHFGVDFAYSDEFRIDHAFTVPLSLISPEMDIPIVPIWANVMAPPVPTSERFYAVGQALRSMIEALPTDKRVVVLASGHLATEVGGPKVPTSKTLDPEFDNRMMELIKTGNARAVVKEATWERLVDAGNASSGFLIYVLAMGLAGGKPTSELKVYFPETISSVPFMAWDLE